jgi:Tol biopolymer transport system component
MMLSAAQSPPHTLLRGVLVLLLSLVVVGPVPVRADQPTARAGDTKIVYHTYRYGPVPQICIMDPDGTNITRLTFTADYEQCPTLSPDGARIAFESTRNSYTNHVWVMDADGGNRHRVTTVSNEEAHAAWSPSGTKIACSVVVGSTYDIYTMNADGTNRLRLTTDPAHDMAPDWSPDGTRILFTSSRSGHYETYVMNSDGTDQAPLLDTSNDTYGAKWCPDGTRIVYVMAVPSPPHSTIRVVNIDGTGDTAILDTVWDNFAPDWAPDGSRIAFMSLEYGSTGEICSMLPDGADVQRLTFGLTNNGPPNWGPTPATSGIESPGCQGATLSVVNPARARADLRLTTEQAGPGSLAIFDSAGRLVRTLLREPLMPGTCIVSWDGRNDAGRPVGTGMYYCRLVSGEASHTAKLVFVR